MGDIKLLLMLQIHYGILEKIRLQMQGFGCKALPSAVTERWVWCKWRTQEAKPAGAETSGKQPRHVPVKDFPCEKMTQGATTDFKSFSHFASSWGMKEFWDGWFKAL